MTSRSRIGSRKFIASIATVATGPSASRLAMIPAAMSIWLSTQPPKMWPLALMSDGPGTTLRVGSPLASVIVVPVVAAGLFVVPGPVGEKNEAHQAGADEHGETDARDRCDHHVDRHRIAEALEIDQRQKDADQSEERHPAHRPLVALPRLRRAFVIRRPAQRERIVSRHGFPLAFASGIIKGPRVASSRKGES